MNTHQKHHQPVLIILVGFPLSGKDTLVRKACFDSFVVISRDDILRSLGSGDYRKDYSGISSKEVDKYFFRSLAEASSSGNNVVVNATNLTMARRKRTLNFFTQYHKVALVFPLIDFDEFCRRNEWRAENGGKRLPVSLYKDMVSIYRSVNASEGFDVVKFLDVGTLNFPEGMIAELKYQQEISE